MPNPEFFLYWKKKRNEIFRYHETSLTQKLLAYKIFLRPLLIYFWYEGQDLQYNNLEIQTLRKIFGKKNIKHLYRLYTDIDVTRYLNLLQITWKKATGSDISNLRGLIKSLVKNSRFLKNPALYYRQCIKTKNHH